MKLLGENSRDINHSTLNVNEPSSCFMKSYSMLYALLDFITCFMFYKTLLALVIYPYSKDTNAATSVCILVDAPFTRLHT